jgi:hypothetical protein
MSSFLLMVGTAICPWVANKLLYFESHTYLGLLRQGFSFESDVDLGIFQEIDIRFDIRSKDLSEIDSLSSFGKTIYPSYSYARKRVFSLVFIV